MTITLERPDARVARTDSHPDLPLPGPRGVRRAPSPFGTPARAASEEPLPPGVRLVRKRAAAPTSTLGRKLTMLAPVALLAGVSAGAVTLTPHVQGLVDGVRDQFGGSASAAPAHAMSEHAAPKHRATTSDTPDAGRTPQQHPHQAKHRAAAPSSTAAPTSTAGSPTVTDATPPAGTRGTTAGSHRAVSGSDDTPSATTQTGGKHKAAPEAPTSQPPTSEAPPSDPPPATNPAPGTSDPVGTLVKDVGKTLDNTVTTVLGG